MVCGSNCTIPRRNPNDTLYFITTQRLGEHIGKRRYGRKCGWGGAGDRILSGILETGRSTTIQTRKAHFTTTSQKALVRGMHQENNNYHSRQDINDDKYILYIYSYPYPLEGIISSVSPHTYTGGVMGNNISCA